MELTRFFGPHRLDLLMDLGRSGPDSWHIMRAEDGSRLLLQRIQPRPDDKKLDVLREGFLGAFLDADPSLPVHVHFGFDEEQVWFVQRLDGVPLQRAWSGWSNAQRQEALRELEARLARLRQPRFLHPEAICLREGLFILPRTLGDSPWGLDQMRNLLPPDSSGLPAKETPLWELPRNLADGVARPIRGRVQELTYVKSLMLGLSAPTPMERIIVLQGEEGIGKEQLAAWACAVAEGDGLWVHRLACAQEEGGGRLLERLLVSLLQGSEAELYSQRPSVAKAISRRVPAFAFLAGGRHRPDDPLEPEEIQASLEALDFAGSLHPRLIAVSDLDRAGNEALVLLRELVHRSSQPWLLSVTTGAKGTGLRPFLAFLKSEPAAALVNLNRLEDEDLRLVLDDVLVDHRLPEGTQSELLRHSLGNSGLLRSLLELAQQDGSLRFDHGRWQMASGRRLTFRAETDLMGQVFLGRLQRLLPATAALVRLLALADRPLPIAALGQALGLAGDPMEEALHGAVASKLVLLQGADASIPDPGWRELVRAQTPRQELRRLAKLLLGALPEGGLRTALSVPLQTLAADDATALTELLKALERTPVSAPREAQQVVRQALLLKPGPAERARLLEWLADAWTRGGNGLEDGLPLESAPAQQALDALNQALEALGEYTEGDPLERAHAEARMVRKKALLLLRTRRLTEAAKALAAAASLLKDEPNHAEQPRLRLAQAKLHLLKGETPRGVETLEEALRLLQTGKHPTQDQVDVFLELGRALAHQGQFHRSTAHLQSAQRLLELEKEKGHRDMVPVQLALAQVGMAQGQGELSLALLQEALQTARYQGDLSLQGQTHLALGMTRSVLEQMGPSLAHLDRAAERFHRLGEQSQSTLAQLWKARTLAALGDQLSAEHLQLQALSSGSGGQATPLESGDQAFLQAEVAGYATAWRDSARLYQVAADRFGPAGLSWRQRLAVLRALQCDARQARHEGRNVGEASWNRLEELKALVEGSASRWLDLEWERAHALLLASTPASEAVDLEALQAWGEVLSLSRALRFPTMALEACTEAAQLLLRRGEKFGAMSRLQDAFPTFQQLWLRVPETHEQMVLGRADIHHFRELVDSIGLRFQLPERGDPLADWTPTQANLPLLPEHS